MKKVTNKEINLALKWFWSRDIATNVSKASELKKTYDGKIRIFVKGYQIEISDLELKCRAKEYEEIMKQEI